VHDELARLSRDGLLRSLRRVESGQGPHVRIDGRTYVLMAGNNYLGLAGHPALKQAAIDAIGEFGIGSGASRLISGNTILHEKLEARLALFKQAESALVFNSGYAANLSLIPCLAPENGLVLLDRLSHASLIDGARLSGRPFRTYGHRDPDKLERLLRSRPARQAALIVTEGVFSMDGDIAPLVELVSLARRYEARILLDDAHATGVLGRNGRGSLEHFGIVPSEDVIQMGTLGKAVGTFGAFVTGPRDLIRYLLNTARSFIYTTSLPPAVCAASIAAIDLIEKEPERRERLWRNRTVLSDGIRDRGLDPGNSESPILPVLLGDSERAVRFSEILYERGILAPAIRPPTVPRGTSRIRMTAMSDHSAEDLNRVLNALDEARRTVIGD
jgi:8-amino-7-oxononanoate synthase